MEALLPVPTYRDLVDEDGSPTSLGLRFSVSAAMKSSFNRFRSMVPMDLGFLMNAIHVTDVRKGGCNESNDGGFWCGYSMRFSGPPQISMMLSQLPSRTRFVLRDLTWKIVEYPPVAKPRDNSLYDEVQRQGEATQRQFQDLTLQGIMM